MKKNILKRIEFKNNEKQNLILKILSNNTLLDKEKRTKYAKIRHKLNSKSSISRIRNTCIQSYRNRGNVPQYKLSRFLFKKYIENGFIPGVRKV